MSEIAVRIERMPALRVAWVRSFGTTPEQDAWRLLSAWAGPAGLLSDTVAHPVFGFNSPAAAPDTLEHGYEFWLAIDGGTQPPDPIGVKDFEGGLYAVTACQLGPTMRDSWKALLRWVHRSPHRWRRDTHELEHLTNPVVSPDTMTVELCLPIDDRVGDQSDEAPSTSEPRSVSLTFDRRGKGSAR